MSLFRGYKKFGFMKINKAYFYFNKLVVLNDSTIEHSLNANDKNN